MVRSKPEIEQALRPKKMGPRSPISVGDLSALENGAASILLDDHHVQHRNREHRVEP